MTRNMTLTFRFRGEFRQVAGRDSVVVDMPGAGPISLDAAVTRLLDEVPSDGGSGDGTRDGDSDGRSAGCSVGCGISGIRAAAFFCDGRLLRPQDPVLDGSTIHILSPLAGG